MSERRKKIKSLSHKMTVCHKMTVLVSQNVKCNSKVLMSQNVLVSQNYVIKVILKQLLVQVGSFMMWWNDDNFWPTDGYKYLSYEFCSSSVCRHRGRHRVRISFSQKAFV